VCVNFSFETNGFFRHRFEKHMLIKLDHFPIGTIWLLKVYD